MSVFPTIIYVLGLFIANNIALAKNGRTECIGQTLDQYEGTVCQQCRILVYTVSVLLEAAVSVTMDTVIGLLQHVCSVNVLSCNFCQNIQSSKYTMEQMAGIFLEYGGNPNQVCYVASAC